MLFSSDYKHFYCQYNEPSYVKKLKLDMLTAVANENNTYKIAALRRDGLGAFAFLARRVARFTNVCAMTRYRAIQSEYLHITQQAFPPQSIGGIPACIC
ncbi:hypothetical protein Syun_006166 [Stephania yunnanensis]|uniref:Uncharacterized protein n=1 Tax=Stephania yunnanensis TaxID=152371 RepID=A0AAP0KYQ0_9MAGN